MTPLAKKILKGLRETARANPPKLQDAVSHTTAQIQIGLMDTVHEPTARSTKMREALEEVLTLFLQKERESERATRRASKKKLKKVGEDAGKIFDLTVKDDSLPSIIMDGHSW